MSHLHPLPHIPGEEAPDPDQFESGEIVAICRVQNGRLVIEEAAYLRMVSGPEGCMIAAAPVGSGDEPDTVALGGASTYRPLDLMRGCASSRSRFLRRLFGRRAPEPRPAESLGDLLVQREMG